jgi:hypothetical protein
MLTVLDGTGRFGKGLLVPAVMCDGCGTPAHGESVALWLDSRRNEISAVYFAHDGCADTVEAAHLPGPDWSAHREPLGSWLEQLAYNVAHPFADDPNVRNGEAGFAALKPHKWRLGTQKFRVRRARRK